MILIIKDSLEGNSNMTKTYQEDMLAFQITNDHDTTPLSFTIHGITITVAANETFTGKFTPFRSVTIQSTVPYRAIVLAPFNGIFPPSEPDTTAPEEVTNLTANNVTATSLALSWTASTSEDVTEYRVYQNGAFLASVSGTSMELTGLTPATEYTFRVVAIDRAKNESNGSEITVTTDSEEPTPGIITDGLILHYDFTNKAGTTSNTITDTVNGVEPTLVGIEHNGTTDGYIDNRGLTLLEIDYVNIPIHTSSVWNALNPNSGLTIVYTSYDTNGVLFRTDDDSLRVHTSAVLQTTFQYLASNGTRKRTGLGASNLSQVENGASKGFLDVLYTRGTQKLNTFVMRFNPNRTVNIFINDYKDRDSYTVPEDFTEFVNILAERSLQLNRNIVALNSGSESIVNFSIYNKALTDQEILQNYRYFEGTEVLQSVSVHPSNVTLNTGENQRLSVIASPSQYTELMDNTFQSGNEGFVSVSEDGLLTALHDGETIITVTSTYGNQTFTNYVNVTVGEQTAPPPTTSRNIDGIVINRRTDSIEVGEYFVVMATALSSELPYDIFNDNIVIWESSNTNVARVQYGVVEGVSAGTATLTAYDATKTHSESFEITVTDPTYTTLTDEEVYHVDANEYSIKLDNTDSTSTTNGIQAALDFASSIGYKKIIFPYGTYLINPTVRTIYPPSDMIIDFSDSSLNIEPSELTETGYTMFYFTNLKNTKLMRAHVYGERDSTTIQNSVENCLSVLIDDCLNTGFESCTFSKSPGFNVITGTITNRSMGKRTQSISVSRFNFEPGNIDENGQIDNSVTENYYRYNQYMDVSGLGEYYLLGYTQGYHGYPHLRSRLYSIHFYDEDYNYIESQMYNLQYYNYPKPANAHFAKIVIYQEFPPSSGDTDFNGAVAFIRTMGMPRDCYIKNCTFEENFSTGLAMCGGQNWTIEGNTFSNNGGRMPNCDIDWEDGWEHMVGDVLKNNTFNSRLGVIFSAGGSLAAFNNTFNQSTMTVWGRTQNYRIFNNLFNGKGSLRNSFSTQGDSVLARNIFANSASYSTGNQHANADYQVHDINNIIV